MAENPDSNWRDRLNSDRDSDKQRIHDGLNTTAGTITVTVILVVLGVWAIVGTFI